MQIRIREHDVEVTEALRVHVERRLGIALGRFGDKIGRVVVRLSSARVDAGGLVKRCQIDVACAPSRCGPATWTRTSSPPSTTRATASHARSPGRSSCSALGRGLTALSRRLPAASIRDQRGPPRCFSRKTATRA